MIRGPAKWNATTGFLCGTLADVADPSRSCRRKASICGSRGIEPSNPSAGLRDARLYLWGDTPGRKVFLCCRCKLGAIENPLGVTIKSSRRYSHPQSPNAERPSPGGAYHPVEP